MAERTGARYPDTSRRRLALAPAVVAVIALLAGLAYLGSGGFLVVRFVVAILALICGWFAIQGRQWWSLPPLAAIAVLWNPVFPFPFAGAWWTSAQLAAAVVFLVVGALVRVRVEGDRRGGAGDTARRRR